MTDDLVRRLKKARHESPLPDCMMPDGGDPCRGFTQLYDLTDEAADRIERLTEALRPFAETATHYKLYDESRHLLSCCNLRDNLTVGHLREAARTLVGSSPPAPSSRVTCPSCEGEGTVEHHSLDEVICCVKCEGEGSLALAPSAREAAASACVKALEAVVNVLRYDGHGNVGMIGTQDDKKKLTDKLVAALSLARDAGFGKEGV